MSNEEIKFIYNKLGAKAWNLLLKKAPYCSFQQDWAYGTFLNLSGTAVSRVVIYKGDEPVALVQISKRKFLKFYTISLSLRGPVWLFDLPSHEKNKIFERFLQEYPRKFRKFLIISPDEEKGNALQRAFKNQKRRKIYTGHSTILVNLNQDQETLWSNLRANTRNKIRKAQKKELRIVFSTPQHKDFDFLLSMEKEQQSRVNYQSLPVDFVKCFAEYNPVKKSVICIFAYAENSKTPIAGGVFIKHGQSATYHIGWNGEEGRKACAMNLILWEAMVQLRKDGITTLDLGGLNMQSGKDIAHFKMGYGGTLKTLLGSYL